MAVIAVQTLSRTGIVSAGGTAASAGGDSFANDGNTFFKIVNGSGSSINVSFPLSGSDVTRAVDGQAVTAKVVAVAAGATVDVGPFPKSSYDDSTGSVSVTYSAVTTVTVRAISVPRTA